MGYDSQYSCGPDALDCKYPNAPEEWDWQWAFPPSRSALPLNGARKDDAVVFNNEHTVGGDKLPKEKMMSNSTWRVLSNICFVAGFLSIIAAIAIWFMTKEPDPAHGERFGIFVGLWAPTFFALSNRLERYSAPKITGS